MLGWCLGVPHRIGSALCYYIQSNKGKLLSHTTVQHLTADEPRNPNIHERVRDYHGLLEDKFVSEDFGTSLYDYEFFINDDEEGTEKGEPNER